MVARSYRLAVVAATLGAVAATTLLVLVFCMTGWW
jgi:hypothetical protein